MRTYDLVDFNDFTEMYQQILHDLVTDPQYIIKPRGLPVRELVNATVIVNPNDCHIDFTRTGAADRQEVYDRYHKAELEWYLSGNTLASSAPSKFWGQLADSTGHITSNYGYMMLFDPVYPKFDGAASDENFQTAFQRVVETLRKDPDSRQAIVHYNQPRHCYPENKDFPCTVYAQFFLRDGNLSMTTYQRSCDIIKGFSYDVPWNVYFLKMVAAELIVPVGEFTHVFGSLHLYEKDLELAKKIIA